MTKPTFILLLFICISKLAIAQLSPEKIAEGIQEADEYILSEDYKEALLVLNNLSEKGAGNANIDFKTGFCYLQTVAEKDKAFSFLKNASENISKNYNQNDPAEKNAPAEALLYLGDAYRIKNNLSQAVTCYKKFANIAENDKSKEIAEKRIKECQIAKLLQSRPIDARSEMLPEEINQGLANLNPVTSADGKTLIFLRKMKFYDAIFFTKKAGENWQAPNNITTQVGSDGEFYPTALSADGTRLLLSSYNALSGQDIYESTWTGSRWSKLKKLDEGVNSKFVEINASYSPDGKTIFFASNRDNGFGGYDIYKSDLRADGSWSRAINLGPTVNTPGDEKNPHLIDDGKLLIFSSEGHLCMGGYDLFYIDYPIQSNSTVKNVGYPINTVLDDLSFYPVQSEKSGFIAKHSENAKGETDIFKTHFESLSKLFEISVKTPLEITGLASGDSVWLFMVDASLNDTIDRKKLPENPGTISYQLYPGNFKLIAENSDRQSQTAPFNIPETSNGNIIQIPLTVAFKNSEPVLASNALVKKDSLQIRNILFEFNSFALNSEYESMLNEIARILTENPAMTLSLTGYADSLGQEAYNKILSHKRAGEVLHTLSNKGIDSSRIKATGGGSTNFITVNSNSEGRKYNRRVEISFGNIPENIIILKKTGVPLKLILK